MKIILKNINLSDKEENDDNKNAEFIYISDEELDFIGNSDIDDKNSDNKLRAERETREADILIRNNII
jgi:hypothetical protein